MKVADLDTDCTYIICPKPTCRLFWKPDGACPCDGQCPYQEKQKLVVAFSCGHMEVLPGGDSMLRRIDHPCTDSTTKTTFVRASGRYRLLYELPEE